MSATNQTDVSSDSDQLGLATSADIIGQIDAWTAVNDMLLSRADEIRQAWNDLDIDQVHITGCGSVNYLSQTTAPLLQDAVGLSCSAAPGSAYLGIGGWPMAKPERALLIVASRSGETSEMVQAVAAYRARGGHNVWCITTRSQSTLSRLADFVISTDEGYEPSVVQTRSFSALLAMAQGLATVLGGGKLHASEAIAAAGSAAIERADSVLDQLGPLERFERVIVLGTRLGFGLAQEGQLLMNEMALTDSSSHVLLDFRHGPISMVDSATLVVALLDPSASEADTAVVDDAASLGAAMLVVTMGPTPKGSYLSASVDPNGLGHLPLMLPILQRLGLRIARSKGINPDRPRHLSAVVILQDDD